MPYLIAIAVLGLLALAYAFFIEPGRLAVRSYRVSLSETDMTLRVARGHGSTRLRVIYFSDLHVGPFFQGKRLDRFCRKVLARRPDLICFGGDLVTEESDVKSDAFRQTLIACFARFTASVPVVAVYGNHDVEDDVNHRLTDAVYKSSGVTLLTNAHYTFEKKHPDGSTQRLNIFGTEEGFFGTPERPPSDFSGLLLCHEPDLVPDLLGSSGPVLALSGHTHRGQVTLAGLPIVKVPFGRIYTYGLYVFNQAQALLVSAGVGTVHLPFRFGALPEIIELQIDVLSE